MARARNIKPGYFRNAELVELSFEARLLFIGLWTIADREGRLEDRPKQIKMEIFPADNVDCDLLLTSLCFAGMIERYTVEAKNYIDIISFTKHQNPHKDEKTSEIPNKHGVLTDARKCKHDASTVQPPCKTNASTKPILLNPESINLNPEEKHIAIGKPNCPHQEIINLYHEVLPASPRIKDWTPARAASLKARWNEGTDRQTLDYWRGLFEYISGIPFLTGRTPGSNGHKPFVLSLDWLLKAENFAKVREGRYEDAAA